VRNVYELLREKESAMEQLRREVAALRSVTSLLADGSDASSNISVPPGICREDGTETVSQLGDALHTIAMLRADENEEYLVKLRARRIEAAESDFRRSKTISGQLRHVAASWLSAMRS